MTTRTDQGPYRQDKIFRCQCGDDHFLAVSYYTDDPEGWLTLIDGTHCTSFWCKVKSAWQIIRKGNAPHFGVEVVLDKTSTDELLRAMSEAARHLGKPAD